MNPDDLQSERVTQSAEIDQLNSEISAHDHDIKVLRKQLDEATSQYEVMKEYLRNYHALGKVETQAHGIQLRHRKKNHEKAVRPRRCCPS